MNPKKTAPEPPKKEIQYTRRDDFAEFYANNAQFIPSFWDLKIVFGELQQSLGPNNIVQHSAVTLPWPQAKVLLHFLQMNMAGYESQNGRIILTQGLVQEFPAQPPAEADEKTVKTWKVLRKLYDEFIAANPEVAPSKAR